jgi:putative salt-induced outer membrane protein
MQTATSLFVCKKAGIVPRRNSVMYSKSSLVFALLFSYGLAHAQGENPAAAAAPESPWFGKLSLGYLSTSGNTDTTTYKTAFEVGYEKNRWKHILDGGANGAEDTGVSTAESYQLAWKTDYSFAEKDYVFGLINWNKDRFSGVTEQLSQTVGYGRRVIETPGHVLNLEIGAGNRDADLSDGTSESGAIVRGGLDYTWIFNETSGFDQDLNIETGSDNTYIESVSALRAKVFGDFAIVLSYTVRQNSDVPVGNVKTDKLSAVSIEYAF